MLRELGLVSVDPSTLNRQPDVDVEKIMENVKIGTQRFDDKTMQGFSYPFVASA